MPTFKAEDLKDAKTVTFSPQDLTGATSAPSLEASTTTSTLKPSELARKRLTGMGTSPEQVKANPPTATTGPMSVMGMLTDPGFAKSFLTGAPQYGYKDDLKNAPGQSFSGSYGQALNPFAWMAPPMGELLAPTNPGLAPNPEQSNPSSPQYNPTMFNLPDRLVSSSVPHPVDIAQTAYKRGEQGLNTNDMLAGPAALATVGFGPKAMGAGLKTALPPDIALEMANRSTRGALGTKPANFEHGATPDAVTGDLGTQRSQGRFLNAIRSAKKNTMGLVGDKLDPKEDPTINPMDSADPVFEEARSRALGGEDLKIGEVEAKLFNKIRSLDKTMRLNPYKLNELRKWVDGFIDTYKDETTGTVRDLAQNLRGALRHQLNQHAPEVTELNQRVQSYIEAEQALASKITRPLPPARTWLSEARNALAPVVPDVMIRTGLASLLRRYAGQPPTGIPTGPVQGPPNPPMGGASGSWGDQPQTGGPPQLGQGPQIGGGPTNIGDITPQPAPVSRQLPPGPPTAPGGLDLARINAEAQSELNKPPRGSNAEFEPPLTEAQKAGPLPNVQVGTMQSLKANMPPEPTHIAKGDQVSGFDAKGNLVSGSLESMQAIIDPSGKPVWKAFILDTKKGKVVDLPADQVFNKLSGPPKPAIGGKK